MERRRIVGRPVGRRTLHLLDPANLTGGVVTPDSVRSLWSDYTRRVRMGEDDAVVVAVRRSHAAATWFAVPHGVGRVLGGTGPGGAAAGLLSAVDVRHVGARFDRVCLGSGDHALLDLAVALTANGVPVIQVIGAGPVSAALYRACSDHRFLGPGRTGTGGRGRNTPVSDVIAG